MAEEFLIVLERTCEKCEGVGRCYNPEWEEADRAYDAAHQAAPHPTLDMDEDEHYETRIAANDAGWSAMAAFWRERGYYSESRWPPEEYGCAECEGTGTIRREVPLIEALRQVGVACLLEVEASGVGLDAECIGEEVLIAGS